MSSPRVGKGGAGGRIAGLGSGGSWRSAIWYLSAVWGVPLLSQPSRKPSLGISTQDWAGVDPSPEPEPFLASRSFSNSNMSCAFCSLRCWTISTSKASWKLSSIGALGSSRLPSSPILLKPGTRPSVCFPRSPSSSPPCPDCLLGGVTKSLPEDCAPSPFPTQLGTSRTGATSGECPGKPCGLPAWISHSQPCPFWVEWVPSYWCSPIIHS